MEQGYTVTWSIYTDADNAHDAIDQALGMLSDPDNTATIFIAESDKGIRTIIETEDGTTIAEECLFCGTACFEGDGCDEHNAGGFE